MILQQKQSLSSKRTNNITNESIRQFGSLSPYHERVTMQKKYLQEKQYLRSILIMGHLQKMELNAINNRSIETIRKIKAAEEMSKKRNHNLNQKENKISQIKLKIDNRKKTKNTLKSSHLSKDNQEQLNLQKIEQVYEKLIQDYVKQVSKQKILQKGPQRTKIVQQACQTIKAQMSSNFPGFDDHKVRELKPIKVLNQKEKSLSYSSHHMKLPSISGQSPRAKISQRLSYQHQEAIPKSNYNLMIGEYRSKDIMPLKQRHSSRYRSVTEVQCNESLKQLEFEQNYLSRQRMRDEKLFLRKMRLIGAKSIKNRQKISTIIDQII